MSVEMADVSGLKLGEEDKMREKAREAQEQVRAGSKGCLIRLIIMTVGASSSSST